MRTLVIGDIHGCLRAFDALLELIEPHEDDLLVTLGDYVDRGPDSAGVLRRLTQLRKSHRLISLRGNHDELMMGAREGDDEFDLWMSYGGDEVLESYGLAAEPESLEEIPRSHWKFLDKFCVDLHETDSHFFVHGGVRSDVALEGQRPRVCRWTKFRSPKPHVSGKVMVCGHTVQKNGEPLNAGHAVCIDTWVYGRGWLTCLNTESGRVWQANQRGSTRAGHLDDYRGVSAVG